MTDVSAVAGLRQLTSSGAPFSTRKAQIGAVLVLATMTLALLGPTLAPYNPLGTDPALAYNPPSISHPFGTDSFGRDVLSRTFTAARVDVEVSLWTTTTALIVGTMFGAIAGYFGGMLGTVIMRVVDLLLSFPSFILAMAVTAMLGKSVPNLVAALTIAFCPYFVRLTRAEVLRVKEMQYCDAVRCAGVPTWRIVTIHVLPNALTPAFVQATLCLGWSILNIAGLSFLGLGIQPPHPEWGLMVADGTKDILSGEWWTSIPPGAFVMLVALGFNLVSDPVKDLVTPGEEE